MTRHRKPSRPVNGRSHERRHHGDGGGGPGTGPVISLRFAGARGRVEGRRSGEVPELGGYDLPGARGHRHGRVHHLLGSVDEPRRVGRFFDAVPGAAPTPLLGRRGVLRPAGERRVLAERLPQLRPGDVGLRGGYGRRHPVRPAHGGEPRRQGHLLPAVRAPAPHPATGLGAGGDHLLAHTGTVHHLRHVPGGFLHGRDQHRRRGRADRPPLPSGGPLHGCEQEDDLPQGPASCHPPVHRHRRGGRHGDHLAGRGGRGDDLRRRAGRFDRRRWRSRLPHLELVSGRCDPPRRGRNDRSRRRGLPVERPCAHAEHQADALEESDVSGRWGKVGQRALLVAALLVAPACISAGGSTGAGGVSGAPGRPINLSIGYQPYYTQAWSGVAMRGKEFWRKYLPRGSTVTFQVGLQGAVIVNQLVAGKQQIGYMGDMPSLVATSKRGTRDLRIVATLGIARDQCNIVLAKKKAPDFASPEDAIKWMAGKTVATPTGSCTDRFTQSVFKEFSVKPSAYLNQSIEVISSNFQNDRIDGATVWEPVASRLVNQGLAKRVATGAAFDENDAGFLVMSKELIDKRPDV